MSVIKDIRLYKSCIENVDGNSLPQSIFNKDINCIIHRIVMKLREKEFSLGDFDHLYLNFTTCTIENKMALSKRTIDRYYPWYRYYDVEISQNLYELLDTKQCEKEVIKIVEQVLCLFFATASFGSDQIQLCVLEAVEKGENMTMKFKEKVSSKNKAIIYLRYMNSGNYYPLLRVFDLENNLILEKDLPETDSLDAFGTIQLSSKKVTIKPRNNAFSKTNEPICFEF